MATEREAKLSAWAGFAVPDLNDAVEGLAAVPVAPVRLSATYYDTPDLRLIRAGVSLRHRAGGDEVAWTVKLPNTGSAGGAMVRDEIVVPGGPNAMPAEILGLVRARMRTASLAAVARLVTTRRRVRLCDGDGNTVVEVDDDEVSVLDGRRVAARFREIEVEQVGDAPDGTLDRVVALLQEAGAGEPEQVSKIVRALGSRALEPGELEPIALSSDPTVADLVRSALTAGVDRLLRQDPLVRLGGAVEPVHQARVATRRLRSDLRTFRRLLDPEWTESLRDELRWAASELGAVRDADVLGERLAPRVADLPPEDRQGGASLLRRLGTQRRVAGEELASAMNSTRYATMLDRLVAAAHEPHFLADVATVAAADAVPELVRRPWKHLTSAEAALDSDSHQEALHEVRIRAKRLRYALEAVAPVAGKGASRWASAVASVQEVLGDLHDAVVGEEWLRAAAGARGAGGVERALAAGQLIAGERQAAAMAAADWRTAWKKASVKKLRQAVIS